MPRKGHTPKREVVRDPKFDDVVIARLINNVVLDRGESIVQRIVYKALKSVKGAADEEALEVFCKALDNTMPVLEVKGRRIDGATYQVPAEVRPERRQTPGLRWLVLFARERGEKTMAERLVREILDASNGLGASIRRKGETHRTTEANKAFTYYRW